MKSYRRARVTAVHPSSGTCDIVFLDTGQRVAKVEVLCATSSAGCSWKVPSVPLPSSEGAAASVENGMRVLVAHVHMDGNRPVGIIGFSRSSSGLLPSEQDRWLETHDNSGGYMTWQPDGTLELYVAGGGFLRIGTGAAHAAPPLAAGALPAHGPSAITVTLATAHGTLSMDPSGNWTLTGAKLTIGCDTTINGSLTVTGDAKINGIQFTPHEHGNVQNGGGVTSGARNP
jgi:phage baseplate assembly protein gpV